MEFVIVDGEILKKEETNVTSYLWNEPQLLLFKIWFGYGGIPLFPESVARIRQYLNITGAEIPAILKNQRELFRLTKRMLNKNKFFRSGYVNIHLFIRKRKVNTLITSTAFATFEFPISEQGLLLQFSGFNKFSGNPLGKYHLQHQITEEAEKAEILNSLYQNSIFLNENNVICDAIGANIFMFKNNTLITPSLETGCIDDILRSLILEIAVSLGYKVLESASIKKKDLLQMNEIFLADSSNGIKWIMGVENKRFVRQNSIYIHKKLVEFLKNKVH